MNDSSVATVTGNKSSDDDVDSHKTLLLHTIYCYCYFCIYINTNTITITTTTTSTNRVPSGHLIKCSTITIVSTTTIIIMIMVLLVLTKKPTNQFDSSDDGYPTGSSSSV